MVKRKSKAVVTVPDGAGGMIRVEDQRFEPPPWQIAFDVTKQQAETWFSYFDVECNKRGWSSRETGQSERRENSGSITINTNSSAQEMTLIWERRRGGVLKVRASSTGAAEIPLADMDAFFETISSRCRSGVMEQFYRRGQLYYTGLPWRGELWLDDAIRLGPPSQLYEGTLHGPRVILVDAMVDSIGPKASAHVIAQLLQEVAIFMAIVSNHNIRVSAQSELAWTYTIVNGTAECEVRWLGYVEQQNPDQMPVRGQFPPAPLHHVERPDFSLSINNIVGAVTELSLPSDITALWAAYRGLKSDRRRQFMQAAAKWQEASMHWRHRPTLSFALLVVACEALKPSGRQFKEHNINDVAEALLGDIVAARLQEDWFRACHVRNVHLHIGEFRGSEFVTATIPPRFDDPTFEFARRELEVITRAAIIEWLRRQGVFSMPDQPKSSRKSHRDTTPKPSAA
jgi:hypothetical protein